MSKATSDVNYRKLITGGLVTFGGLYVASTFGASWAFGLAVLVALSVLITGNGGATFAGVHGALRAINKGLTS